MSMEDRAKIFKALLDLGLTKNEAKVYIALIGLGEAKASEISRKSGVVREKTYKVLRSLEEKKLVKVIDGQPTRWRVVPPSEIFKPVIESRKKVVMEMEEVLEELQKIYNISREKGGKEELNVWKISEKDLENYLTNLLETCKERLYILATPLTLDLFHNPIMLKYLKRLYKMRGEIKIFTWIEDENIHTPARLSNYGDVYILDGDPIEYSIILIDGYAGFIVKDGRSSIIYFSDRKIGESLLDIFGTLHGNGISIRDYIELYDATGSLDGLDTLREYKLKEMMISIFSELITNIGRGLSKEDKNRLYNVISVSVKNTLARYFKSYGELSLTEKIKLLKMLLKKTMNKNEIHVSLDKFHDNLYLNISLNLDKDVLHEYYEYLFNTPWFPHPIIILMDYEIKEIGYKRVNPVFTVDRKEGRVNIQYIYKAKENIKIPI